MTWSAVAVRNLKFFFRLSAARRLRLLIIGGGDSKVLIFFPLSATPRLKSLQMSNSFQNKKNICLFRYLNVNLFKNYRKQLLCSSP